MADEDVGEAEFVLQVLEEIEHLRLHRDVERAHRLVEHQHLGLQRQAAGDGDALALAAGELVRVLAEARRSSRPTLPAARVRASRFGVARGDAVDGHRLDQRLPTVKRGFSEA